MTVPAPDIDILISWAIFSRPDWDPGLVEKAVAAARNAQWGDAKIAVFLVRILFDTASTPWDLRNAASQPQGTAATVPASPEVIARYAAEVRSKLRPGPVRALTGAALAAHQALEARLAAAKTDWVTDAGDGPE